MPSDFASDTLGEVAVGLVQAGGEGTSLAFTRNQRWTLIIVSVVAYFATSLLFRNVLPLFQTPGFGGSLLLDANPIISLTFVFVWCIIVFALSAVAGRTVRPDVGLFAVAVAMFALRNTGGLTREVYFAHPSATALRVLGLELALLAAFMVVLAFATQQLVRRGILHPEAALDGVRPKFEPMGQRFLATFVHFMVVCVIVLTVLRSDERMQVTAILIIASMLASICAVRLIPAMPSAFFWFGPIVAGLVGYFVTSFVGLTNISIGEPSGYCAGLARALPLDFVSAGVGGAIYGYWIGRGWIPEDSLQPVTAERASTVPSTR